MRRNLIYFIAPFRSNSEWLYNISNLSQFWKAFNNKIVVTVVTGHHAFVPLDEVKAAFPQDDRIVWREMENSRFCETPSFLPMLDIVQSLDPDEMTFFAHAKGTSPFRAKQRNFRLAVGCWRRRMYHRLLCELGIHNVEILIKKYPVIGTMLRKRWMPDPPVPWHFHGTFFWLRHDALFSRDWRKVSDSKCGVEGYPAQQFKLEEAKSVYGEWNGYSPFRGEGLVGMPGRRWRQMDKMYPFVRLEDDSEPDLPGSPADKGS